MTDEEMGIVPGRGCAIARFADTLLQSLGGMQVTLRMSDPATGDNSSQLGMTCPTAEDIQITPAIIKPLDMEANSRRRIEVIVSGTSLRTIAKAFGVEDVFTWLLGMQGVLHYGGIMRITNVTVDQFHGTNCLYHLTATE